MQQVHPRADRDEVGRDVERVGDDERADEQPDDDAPRATESHDQELAEPLAGRERGPVADLLHAGHQGEGDERHPQHPEAELRAGLRVGGDARGIVVRGPGNETGAKRTEIAVPSVLPGSSRHWPSLAVTAWYPATRIRLVLRWRKRLRDDSCRGVEWTVTHSDHHRAMAGRDLSASNPVSDEPVKEKVATAIQKQSRSNPIPARRRTMSNASTMTASRR
jgi:hypothetical protein